jgi:NitT/TauT family transport system substrate-binding protein
MRAGWASLLIALYGVAVACGGAARPETAPAAQPAVGPAAAAAAPSPSPPRARVRAAHSTISGSVAPLWLARQLGLWERHGLEVELTNITGTPVIMAALISGEVQFAQTSGDAALSVQAREPEVLSLLNTVGAVSHRMMVVPSIQRPEDLRGKRLGVFTIGDGNYAYLTKALPKLGVDPNEVVWTAVGGGNFAGLVQALAAGAIDGTLLTPPNDLLARRAGAHELFRLRDLGIPTAGLPVYTLRRLVREQPQVAEAFAAGVVEGVRWFKAEPATARRVLREQLRIEDEEVLEWTHATLLEPGMMLDRPFVDRAQVRAVLELLAEEQPDLRHLQVERITDTSILEALDRRGLLPPP